MWRSEGDPSSWALAHIGQHLGDGEWDGPEEGGAQAVLRRKSVAAINRPAWPSLESSSMHTHLGNRLHQSAIDGQLVRCPLR